jgi:hypothetical protein
VFDLVICEGNASEFIANGSSYSISRRRDIARKIAHSDFGEAVLLDFIELVPPIDISKSAQSEPFFDYDNNYNIVVLIVLLEKIEYLRTPEGLAAARSYVNDPRYGRFSVRSGNFLLGRARAEVVTESIGLRARQLIERSEAHANP